MGSRCYTDWGELKMKERVKLIAGMLVFGSLWGFSEVILGSLFSDMGLPAGGIMTGVFVLLFLIISRLIYQKAGMQLGMGLVAGTMRLFNPFAGCHVCSAIAIMAEAALFELLWYGLVSKTYEHRSITMQASMGITTAYVVYVGGYIVTQILTPMVAGAGFYVENLLVFLPRILASGLLPAFLGGSMVPLTYVLHRVEVPLKETFYYPATLGISALCWFVVLGNFFLVA
jgi:hypothetical protein